MVDYKKELKDKVAHRRPERMPDMGFRLMSFIMDVLTFIRPSVYDERVRSFGIKEGMTVVDYGCGPGRYTIRFSKLVGDKGKVYAVDIHELAIAGVEGKMQELSIRNIETVLARGNSTSIPDHVADRVCALDMFFMVKEPSAFLRELERLTKRDGLLVIDDGHQRRAVTRNKILASGVWTIEEQTADHLKCRPARTSAWVPQ